MSGSRRGEGRILGQQVLGLRRCTHPRRTPGQPGLSSTAKQSTAGTLLARKRSRLSPVHDNVAWCALGKPSNLWTFFEHRSTGSSTDWAVRLMNFTRQDGPWPSLVRAVASVVGRGVSTPASAVTGWLVSVGGFSTPHEGDDATRPARPHPPSHAQESLDSCPHRACRRDRAPRDSRGRRAPHVARRSRPSTPARVTLTVPRWS